MRIDRFEIAMVAMITAGSLVVGFTAAILLEECAGPDAIETAPIGVVRPARFADEPPVTPCGDSPARAPDQAPEGRAAP